MGEAMSAAGMRWLCNMGYSPKWASVYPNSENSEFNPPKPEYYDEWENWIGIQVRAILAAGMPPERLEIEIWNEENWFMFWLHPNPRIYVELLKRATRVIRGINPNIKVVFGGMAPSPDQHDPNKPKMGYRSSTFVKACYDAGMTGADFNKMNIHPYNGQQPLNLTAGKPWDMNTTIMNEITKVMADHGNPNKKFDFTEFGYSTKGSKALSQDDQAKLLVAQIDYLRRRPNAGIPYVFNWRELGSADTQSNGYGIHRLDGTPKKAVGAIKAYLAANP
jgi:hypothetical protein